MAFHEYRRQLAARFHEIESELRQAGYCRLPRALVHSEYVAKHVRMRDDRVVGLLDFEYVSRGARAVDVALALDDFPCSARERMDFDEDRIRPFLAGYNSSGSSLSDAEVNALPLVLKAWCADSLGYWIRRVARTAKPIALFDVRQRVREDLQYIDAWGARAPAFVAMVSKAV
jgi:Ser/Thr protein kinase RdoA (MazF antagonist)